MQEVTMLHTEPDIIVISIDADGCYLGRSLFENCTYEPTPDQVEAAIKHNAYLIEDVLLARPINSELRINCGSARNCLNTNYINAKGAGYFSLDGSQKKGTGSYYPFLEGLQQYFQSLGVNTTLDRFLLADIYFDRLAGETWKIAVSKEHYNYVNTYEQLLKRRDDEPANAKEISQKIDGFRENDFRNNNFELFNSPIPNSFADNKTHLLLAQIHRAVAKNPGKKLEFRFYDDRIDILLTLQKITDLEIPQGVTFVGLQHHFLGETLIKPTQIFRIQGKGNLNPSYYQKKSLEVLRSIQKEIRDEKNWETSSSDRVTVNMVSDKVSKSVQITLAMDRILSSIQKAKHATGNLSSETDKEKEYTETLRTIKSILKEACRSEPKSKSNHFYKKWHDFLEERFSIEAVIAGTLAKQQTEPTAKAQLKGIRHHITSHPYFHLNLNETLVNAILTNRPDNSGNLLFCTAGNHQQILLYYKVKITHDGVVTNAIRKFALVYNHQTKLIEGSNLKGAPSLHELVQSLPEYINQPGIVFVPQPICNRAAQLMMSYENPQVLRQILFDHGIRMQNQEKQRVEIAAIVYMKLENIGLGEVLASKNGSKITKCENVKISLPFWSARGAIIFSYDQTLLVNVNGAEILKHPVQPGEDPFVDNDIYQELLTVCQEASSLEKKNNCPNP